MVLKGTGVMRRSVQLLLAVFNFSLKKLYRLLQFCYLILALLHCRLKLFQLELKRRYLRRQVRILFLQRARRKKMLEDVEHRRGT